ncbi:MAG TPA: hypothetical protein PK657_06000 [Legionella sp.]|nr:hypothetical protein [Legionella sp.]
MSVGSMTQPTKKMRFSGFAISANFAVGWVKMTQPTSKDEVDSGVKV